MSTAPAPLETHVGAPHQPLPLKNGAGAAPKAPAGGATKAETAAVAINLALITQNFLYFLELLNNTSELSYKGGIPEIHLDHEEKAKLPGVSDHEHQIRNKLRIWLNNHVKKEEEQFKAKLGVPPNKKLEGDAKKAHTLHVLKILIAACEDLHAKIIKQTGYDATKYTKMEEQFKGLESHKTRANTELAKLEKRHHEYKDPLKIDLHELLNIESEVVRVQGSVIVGQEGQPAPPLPNVAAATPTRGERRGSIDNGRPKSPTEKAKSATTPAQKTSAHTGPAQPGANAA